MMGDLNRVNIAITQWCETNSIPCMTIYDENQLLGIIIFTKDRSILNNLFKHITPTLQAENAHITAEKIRSGTVLAVSTKAITETDLIKIRGDKMQAFKNRINTIMSNITRGPIAPAPKPARPFSLIEQFKTRAKKLVESSELEYNTALQTKADRWVPACGGKETPFTSRSGIRMLYCYNPATEQHAYLNLNTDTIMTDEEVAAAMHSKSFGAQLSEALEGMATQSGQQPNDLFQKFAQALTTLGNNMQMGPLQDKLKERGIHWKKSDDGRHIILFVINADTNAPQPITSISYETLEKPSDFENQLMNLLDFAQGNPPGSIKQWQQDLQAQEKAVREVAKMVGPQDQTQVQTIPAPQVFTHQAPQQAMQAPQAPQAAPQAPRQTTAPTSNRQISRDTVDQAVMPKRSTGNLNSKIR